MLRSLDRGQSPANQVRIQALANQFLRDTDLGLRDFAAAKAGYDQALVSRNCGAVRAVFIEFSEPAPFLVSTAVQPEADFRGRPLQDLISGSEEPLDVVTFSLVERYGRALAVFTWLEGSASAQALVDSLMQLPSDRISDAIHRFAFEYTENLFMSSAWWEALAGSQKDWVRRRTLSSIATARTGEALVDDGCKMPALGIPTVIRIGFPAIDT